MKLLTSLSDYMQYTFHLLLVVMLLVLFLPQEVRAATAPVENPSILDILLNDFRSFFTAFTTSIDSILLFITNFSSSFTDSLVGLFVPSEASLSLFLSRMRALLSYNFGFIYQSFEIVTGIFNRLLLGQSESVINFGRLFGAPFIVPFNFIEVNAPALWTFITTIIRGSIVYYLIVNILNKAKEVFNK